MCCVNMCVFVRKRACICVYENYVHECMRVSVYVRVCIRVHVHVCVLTCLCEYTCGCAWRGFVQIYVRRNPPKLTFKFNERVTINE